jgi:hypothetical protein
MGSIGCERSIIRPLQTALDMTSSLGSQFLQVVVRAKEVSVAVEVSG